MSTCFWLLAPQQELYANGQDANQNVLLEFKGHAYQIITTPKSWSEAEEYANAGITKEKAEAKVETKSTKKKEEKEDDPWVEDEEGNFVRKSTTAKKKKGK